MALSSSFQDAVWKTVDAICPCQNRWQMPSSSIRSFISRGKLIQVLGLLGATSILACHCLALMGCMASKSCKQI